MMWGGQVQRADAKIDRTLTAVVHGLTPLVYSHGALPEHDVAGHVRAASAVRRVGGRLVVVQDDVNVLVLHHHAQGTQAQLLPVGLGGARTFEEARGNKHAKMDLEACAVLPDGRLVAFGSGSTANRERLVIMNSSGTVRIVDGSELYRHLRSETEFSGSELNIEGAVVVGASLRLFQRGNGARIDDLLPVNATCDVPLSELLDWLDGGASAPTMRNVVQYDLGHIHGIRLTFTDAALMADGRVAFVACAEASPDTYRDGEVLGCRFGIVDGETVRTTDIHDEHGESVVIKLEGLERRPDSDTSFDVVADMDRTDVPALIGRLDLTIAR